MARKSSVLQRAAIAVFSVIAIYAILNASVSRSLPSSSDLPRQLIREEREREAPPIQPRVKVYMYDLPTRFTHGVIEQHAIVRGGGGGMMKRPTNDVTALKYPGHQHMHEWYLFSDLNRPESDRSGSPITRVLDPADADLFFVPVFSSLSLIVNAGRPVEPGSGYSDEKMQEGLIDWLERQVWWRRNGGRDHVIPAGDPNALYRILDRVKNAVLLVSDFGRLRPDQGSFVKDVVIPYSHRVNLFTGEIGVESRNTLLFFMGNRYRKDVSFESLDKGWNLRA
ncbi:hypothetical protein F2Q69_00011254 [Brassica cretica]|uniref:Exostosin GT47 domain-containing protein n=1 Tax=Brassica cretica TaxID=69181 RepID=A0A8S9R401_BRACR|nr:hypothetical protein F2Q69_00011254 [Brassica cretica]